MDLLKHIVDASPDEKLDDAEQGIFKARAGMEVHVAQAGDVTRSANSGLTDGGIKTVHFNMDAHDDERTSTIADVRDAEIGNVQGGDGSSSVKKRNKKTRHKQKEHKHKEQRDDNHDCDFESLDAGVPVENVELNDTLDSAGSEKGRRRRKKNKQKPNAVSQETVDPLVVKYYELNEILKRDFIERKQLQSQQQPQPMQHMFRQHVDVVNNRPPPGPRVQNGLINNTAKRLVNRATMGNRNVIHKGPSEKDDTVTHMVRKPRPQSAVVGRPSRSKTSSIPMVRRSRSAGSGRSSGQTRGRRHSLDSARSETQSSVKTRESAEASSSPRRINVPTDCFLKHTDDENIREWLAKKNQLQKLERAATRAKRREQRAAQMDEATRRYDMQVLSKLETGEWMERKRKEASRKAREEKLKKVLAAREEAVELELKRQKLQMLHDKLRNPPVVMVHHSRGEKEKSTKVKQMTVNDEQLIGGETSDNVRNQLEINKLRQEEEEQSETATKINEDGPSPPKTKFIYKRPVTGKIRFKMSKSKSVEGGKQTSERDKNKQARLSYDQWLVKKRADDIDRRKREQAKCRNLASSDPELERIVPEIAKRRMEKIFEQKKKINTGIKHLDHNLNAAFGGGDKRENSYQTDGDDWNRPHTATSRSHVHTKPKISLKSPRRAPTRLETVMEKEETTNPYKLPFPPDQGAPRHVAAKQRKIFAERIWNTQEEERPEPQGCEPSPTIESQFEKEADVIEDDPLDDKPTGESSPSDNREPEDETNSTRYGFKKRLASDSDSSVDEEIPDEKEDSLSDISKQNDLSRNLSTEIADSFFLTSVGI